MAISISGRTSGAASHAFDPSKIAARVASKAAAKMMSELDSNQDGSVSRDEFVAGLTSNGVSVDAAGKLFDTIDVRKVGSIGKSDIESAIKSGAMPPPPPERPAGGGRRAGGGGSEGPGRAGASDAAASPGFAPADTNKDGTVSVEEAAIYRAKHPADVKVEKAESANLGQNVDETV